MILNDQRLNERDAVESLLQLQNTEQTEDWKNNHENQKNNKKSKFRSNIKQLNIKQSNPQNDSQNSTTSDAFMNIHKFKRARSLFDPLKAFKIGLQQYIYNQPLTPEPNLNFVHKRVIHKHPQKIRDLNFKTGHPGRNMFYKKDDPLIQQIKNNSNQFLNGQTVMIQVQSYEQSFNKKQIEYLMSKTLGLKEFKSHMSKIKKSDNHQTYSLLEIRNQDIKIDNTDEVVKLSPPRNDFKNSTRMRATSYFSNKAKFQNTSKKQGLNNSKRQSVHQLSYSLDLKNGYGSDGITASLRQLLNNIKTRHNNILNKNLNNSKFQFKNQSIQNEQIDCNSKIFDKQIILKGFQQQELVRLQKNRIKRKCQMQLGEKFTSASSKQDQSKIYYSKQKSKSKNSPIQLIKPNKNDYSSYMKANITQKLNQSLRISSPQKYYQKANKKNIDEDQTKMFNIKKIV